uniref:Scaffolding anchor of CK1 domain-containing protein n=1 Tax=Monopterus albus TaxID=43700 RepID=A0A3Q3IE26_MONAL
MDSPNFSMLSSLRGDCKSEDYIQPHYKESYRLAIDRLVSDGRDSYQDFLKEERTGAFLSEDELLFIIKNAEQLPLQTQAEEINGSPDNQSSSGTYWPTHSDVETPDLDLGWPEVMHEKLQTNIDLLFHPPRPNNPTIKEVIRKHIQDARQVIAIVMDTFTDVDIFKEIVDASIRGVPVYVLLDHFHLKHFLNMAENQDVKIHQLRNMRVRTVKGQDYLCRSGAKFHGAMEQRFLLVDCHTAIYGSYSFAWSFEKINLSMVQVITGHLVKSYDEEFRILYARSTAPAELCPPEGLFQHNGPQQILPKSHSAHKIERRDQLRHTLDTVYRKTCERNLGRRDLEERLFEEERHNLRPFIENGINAQDRMSQLQSTEAMNFLKRHSYAGERQDGYMPENIPARSSNWNISRETGNGANNYLMDNCLQVPQMYRGQNLRQSYNGNDKQVLNMQQNMPTLEKTAKSFLRTWRIESYLKNSDIPFGDSCDYLDQFELMDRGRMRPSPAFRSHIPEQMEPNRHINNTSTGIGSSAALLHYSSMQWHPTQAPENRINHEFILKQQSLQTLDSSHNNASCGPGRNSYHSTYATFRKMHSINRSTAGISAQNGGYVSNLNEDQRSVSHHDVKSITGTKSSNTPKWQEPLTRTVSAAAVDVTAKHNSVGSQHSLKKASNKIKSLLNIPERKEDSMGSVETSSLKSGGSTDTLTAEDEVKTSGGSGKFYESMTDSVRSFSEHNDLNSSKPRFKTEEQQQPPEISRHKTTTKKKPAIFVKTEKTSLDTGSWVKDRGAENRIYSRFEPFHSLEKKHFLRSTQSFGNTQSQEKSKGLPKVEAATEHSPARPARGHHENKLEKFFQRMGNLIHKNK